MIIANLLDEMGYQIKHFAPGEDIGIDIIASNEKESVGIQVKKYVSRKVNLPMVYHTYGAAAYYDCNKSVIATLNELTPRAMKVAKKLNIEIWNKELLLNLFNKTSVSKEIQSDKFTDYSSDWFFQIWNNHVKTLEGKKIKHISRDTYITIIEVEDDGLSIINSNGRRRKFNIDIFRRTLAKLKKSGSITREEINNDYKRRGSSAISAILVTIPGIYKDTIVYKTTIVWER